MLLLIEYCSNWCKLTMADYLVAHCLVYSTGVFQYQSVLVLAPVRCRAREILLFPHSPHSWCTLSHLHHGANLEATIFKFWWFLGHFDQNELYHTPLLSKIWDLGDRIFSVEDSFKDHQWWHDVTSPTNVKIGEKRHDKKSLSVTRELVINMTWCLSSSLRMITWLARKHQCISNIAWCLSSQIGMFWNEVTWPELEKPCITNLTL